MSSSVVGKELMSVSSSRVDKYMFSKVVAKETSTTVV
jgi:hypothetical protein